MKNRIHLSIMKISGLLLLLAILILPVAFIRPSEMLLVTTNELCQKDTLYSYIVTGLFILFGIESIISGWKRFVSLPFQRFMLLVFSCTFISASLLSHLYQYENLIHGIPLELVHRYFAGLALVSFSVLSFSTALSLSDKRSRTIAFAAGSAILLVSVLQGELHACTGIWQRIVLVIAVTWITSITGHPEQKPESTEIQKHKTIK